MDVVDEAYVHTQGREETYTNSKLFEQLNGPIDWHLSMEVSASLDPSQLSTALKVVLYKNTHNRMD